MKLECQECGAVGRYAVSNETECRNCGGSDLDLAPGTTKDWLRKARGFIVRGWTQGEHARDGWGDRCEPTAAEATEWCTVGAVHAARPGATFRQYNQMFNVLQAALHARDGNVLTLTTYNDARRTRVADILALYDWGHRVQLAARRLTNLSRRAIIKAWKHAALGGTK